MLYAVPDRIEFKGYQSNDIPLTRRLLIRNSSDEIAFVRMVLPNSKFFLLTGQSAGNVTLKPGESTSFVVEFIPPQNPRGHELIHEPVLACSTVGVAMVGLWATAAPDTFIPWELAPAPESRPEDEDISFMTDTVHEMPAPRPVAQRVPTPELERLPSPPEPEPELKMASAADHGWGGPVKAMPVPPRVRSPPSSSPRVQKAERSGVLSGGAAVYSQPVVVPNQHKVQVTVRNKILAEAARLEQALSQQYAGSEEPRCDSPDSLGSHDSYEDQFLSLIHISEPTRPY
eukprot:TRINITY_DN39546_c0_g1_i2.p1 TRINITY_DN39546_c0_g1~~TRINITY_DN39546_c0_g1_i2.p1  ORF type:complete len:287 (+),score=37.42 TRINITY_DN39546_c0_g1_i2:78-938(+)